MIEKGTERRDEASCRGWCIKWSAGMCQTEMGLAGMRRLRADTTGV